MNCTHPNCTEPAEYACANCDKLRCPEHAQFSRMADEWFCASDYYSMGWSTDPSPCEMEDMALGVIAAGTLR